MSNIAPLDRVSSLLGTAAKLLRVLGQEGITIQHLQGPIDSAAKRRNLKEYLMAGCPKLLASEQVAVEPAAQIENGRFCAIDKNTIEVNLGAMPCLPFEGAIINTNVGGRDWVTIKKRDDGIYQNGVKVILHP